MGSTFYAGEAVDVLKLKLLHNKLKIIRAKNLMMQLHNLLNHISDETNRIEHQVHTFLQSMMASSLYPENFLLLPSDANSGITESTCFSHISSPVDPFMDCVSSPEFSNINNVVDTNNNVGFVNEQPWVQPGLVYPEMPGSDPASVVIQSLVEGKVLPEKGKLLQSVMDAGPLLQTLLVAGPLPMWRHPPPSQPINFVPPFTIKDPDIADMGNYADPDGASSSDSMLNFAGVPSGPCIDDQVPTSKRQRLC